MVVCGTLKCENAAICEKVAKCEKKSTLNVKIDAICETITLNVNKLSSLNVYNILTLNVFSLNRRNMCKLHFDAIL